MSTFSMSVADYVFDSVLVLMVLLQIKETPLTRQVFVRPLIIVGIVVAYYVRQVPTSGNDLFFMIVVAAIGAAVGSASGITVHMRRRDGKTLIRAGWASAIFWVLGMGGRFAFLIWISYGSGVAWVTQFSLHHDITSAASWVVAVLAEAVLEVVARTVVMAVRGQQVFALSQQNR